MSQSTILNSWLRQSLDLAKAADKIDEVPVGALIFANSKLISASHNQKENQKDPTSHAEINAIRQAAQKMENWRLSNCTLVTTLEPCIMCAGAIIQARIKMVIYLAADTKTGGFSLYNFHRDTRLNHQIQVLHHQLPKQLREEAEELLKKFFRRKRQRKFCHSAIDHENKSIAPLYPLTESL